MHSLKPHLDLRTLTSRLSAVGRLVAPEQLHCEGSRGGRTEERHQEGEGIGEVPSR